MDATSCFCSQSKKTVEVGQLFTGKRGSKESMQCNMKCVMRCRVLQADYPSAQQSEKNWLDSELQTRDTEEAIICGDRVLKSF